MNHYRGFTLLELMVVLTLMALLTGVISVSLGSISKQTTVRDTVGVVTNMDRSMRDECTEFNRDGEIRIDVELGRITCVSYREGEMVKTESYQVPNTLLIEKVWIQGQGNQANQNGVRVIPCDSRGHTPTYALSIRPHRNIDSGTEAVLPGAGVVAGLTGQVQECQDETQIDDLFESLAGRNAD